MTGPDPRLSRPASLRQTLAMHAMGFGLLGPPLGWVAWLVMLSVLKPEAQNFGDTFLIFLIGLPFSYITGAVPAVAAGLASALLSKLATFPYLLGTVAVGAMTSAVFPGIWLSHGIVQVETLSEYGLIGAAAAFGCAAGQRLKVQSKNGRL